MVSGPRVRQPSGRPAGPAGGRLPPVRRSDRQGDRVHPGRQGRRARQAVPALLLPRCGTRAPPRPARVGRQVQGRLRHGLRGLPRWGPRAPEGDGPAARGRRTLAARSLCRHDQPRREDVVPQRPRPAVGFALGGRAAAVLADGRGLRRFPEPRRPPAGSPARLPGGQRRTRQHDHRPGLRQRGVGRGRTERLGQREQVLQRHPGLDRGEPQAHRRAGQHEDLQPLPDGLGVGVQHAVQAVEAVRQLRGRDGRPLDRRLAEGRQGRRASTGASTPTRSTSSRRSTSASASRCPRSSTASPRPSSMA